ncbi:MAG: polyprenyl synthetase family protein [Bacteroidia bacterium]|nr:polyprenyl synthetase family protein [Bacteroidia bacterium]
MSGIVDRIKAPVLSEMKEFEKKFHVSMKSSVPLLEKITGYIVKRKGKQMRPLFVFLAAKTAGGMTESSYRAAALIELLHTATLVHDDVVDDSNERRGFFSLNALWKNKIAVLVGDYLLSRGLLLSVEHNEFRLLQIVSTAVREMSEGELLQIEKARKLDIEEPVYYDIIRQKTASLIAACCAAGASSSGAGDEVVEKMRSFGENTGMAFQIKDDLFDYGHDEGIGKPTGIDIKEKKLTLPLIYTLSKADKSTQRKIINIVRNYGHDSHKVDEVVRLVKGSGGIEYATERMMEYRAKALTILHELPASDARDSLELLVNYSIERKK